MLIIPVQIGPPNLQSELWGPRAMRAHPIRRRPSVLVNFGTVTASFLRGERQELLRVVELARFQDAVRRRQQFARQGHDGDLLTRAFHHALVECPQWSRPRTAHAGERVRTLQQHPPDLLAPIAVDPPQVDHVPTLINTRTQRSVLRRTPLVVEPLRLIERPQHHSGTQLPDARDALQQLNAPIPDRHDPPGQLRFGCRQRLDARLETGHNLLRALAQFQLRQRRLPIPAPEKLLRQRLPVLLEVTSQRVHQCHPLALQRVPRPHQLPQLADMSFHHMHLARQQLPPRQLRQLARIHLVGLPARLTDPLHLVRMHDVERDPLDAPEFTGNPLHLVPGLEHHQLRLRPQLVHRPLEPAARRCHFAAPHHLLALIDRVHHKTLATHIHSHLHHGWPLSVVVHRARTDSLAFGSMSSARMGPLHRISLTIPTLAAAAAAWPRKTERRLQRTPAPYRRVAGRRRAFRNHARCPLSPGRCSQSSCGATPPRRSLRAESRSCAPYWN